MNILQNNSTLKVSAIKDGTVIDHIPANKLFNVITILGLDKINTLITFGTNLESKTHGKKAIIKIADHFFPDDDINRIALVAPQAKLNIIRDYNVVEKKVVEVPSVLRKVAKCMNPGCITNHEEIPTRFTVESTSKLELKCQYCEKITDKKNIVII